NKQQADTAHSGCVLQMRRGTTAGPSDGSWGHSGAGAAKMTGRIFPRRRRAAFLTASHSAASSKHVALNMQGAWRRSTPICCCLGCCRPSPVLPSPVGVRLPASRKIKIHVRVEMRCSHLSNKLYHPEYSVEHGLKSMVDNSKLAASCLALIFW